FDMAITAELARKEALEEKAIDAFQFSKTAHEKIDAAIRQHRRRLNQEFDVRVQDEIRKRLETTVLPHYKKTEAQYQAIIKSRKGVMDRATYKKILSCLHPD